MSNHTSATQLGDDVIWLEQCYKMENKHHHISPYLIDSENGYILIETGSIEHQKDLKEQISQIVGEDGISAAILSHYDLPHVANASEFRKKWEFDLYTSFEGTSASPESLGMGPSTRCSHGENKMILGRRFNFPWPPLVDAAHSMWVYDYHSKTLFAADMGHYHQPNECGEFWVNHPEAELYIKEYLDDALPFIPYIDPKKLEVGFKDLRKEIDIKNIAPIHGNPVIGRDNVELYLDRYVKAVSSITKEKSPPI